jgi:hypothetical protein
LLPVRELVMGLFDIFVWIEELQAFEGSAGMPAGNRI